MSDSVQPHRQQPIRLPRPWNSPGKNTGVGCHFLLQCMKVKSESEVAQSCPTSATPWTAAYQAPPSMGFSRQEYWSGVPLPSPKKKKGRKKKKDFMLKYEVLFWYLGRKYPINHFSSWVNSLWRSPSFAQDQKSGRAFLSWYTHTKVQVLEVWLSSG